MKMKKTIAGVLASVVAVSAMATIAASATDATIAAKEDTKTFKTNSYTVTWESAGVGVQKAAFQNAAATADDDIALTGQTLANGHGAGAYLVGGLRTGEFLATLANPQNSAFTNTPATPLTIADEFVAGTTAAPFAIGFTDAVQDVTVTIKGYDINKNAIGETAKATYKIDDTTFGVKVGNSLVDGTIDADAIDVGKYAAITDFYVNFKVKKTYAKESDAKAAADKAYPVNISALYKATILNSKVVLTGAGKSATITGEYDATGAAINATAQTVPPTDLTNTLAREIVGNSNSGATANTQLGIVNLKKDATKAGTIATNDVHGFTISGFIGSLNGTLATTDDAVVKADRAYRLDQGNLTYDASNQGAVGLPVAASVSSNLKGEKVATSFAHNAADSVSAAIYNGGAISGWSMIDNSEFVTAEVSNANLATTNVSKNGDFGMYNFRNWVQKYIGNAAGATITFNLYTAPSTTDKTADSYGKDAEVQVASTATADDLVLGVNYANSDNLCQGVKIADNKITFDWDKVINATGTNTVTGNISDMFIRIAAGKIAVVDSITVKVPAHTGGTLAAGAPTTEASVAAITTAAGVTTAAPVAAATTSTNPKTGNAPIALAVIPVAIIAAAVIAKKRG